MAELFNRHCQYCAMRQLLSVPVTALFKNCLYFLIQPRRRKANWIGYSSSSNCLLKHVIEERKEGGRKEGRKEGR